MKPFAWFLQTTKVSTTHAVAAVLTGTSDTTAVGQRSVVSVSAALTGTSDTTAVGQRTVAASAALGGTSNVTATGRRIAAVSATVTGTSDTTAVGQRTATVSAVLGGTSDVAAVGTNTGAPIPLAAVLSGTSDVTATGLNRSLPQPTRAAFYYPWYPETWTVGGQPIKYTPTLGQYDLDDPTPGVVDAIYDQHIAWLAQAGIDLIILSWWGQTEHNENTRIPQLLSRIALAGTGLKVCMYYEDEGFSDPADTVITADLNYIETNYVNDPAYLYRDGKPVIFVYNSGDVDENNNCLSRWDTAITNANSDWYGVFKVFTNYLSATPQPDSWHQYGPASRTQIHAPFSYVVSPGYWQANDPDPPGGEFPYLERSAAAFQDAVEAMAGATGTEWHLVTTFNEWGEGTAIEPATEFGTTFVDIAGGDPTRYIAGALGATSDTTAVGQRTAEVASTLTGTSDTTATGSRTVAVATSLTGSSDTTATGQRVIAALSATLTGTSDVAALGTGQGMVALSVTLTGTSDTTATGTRTALGLSATLTGTSNKTATGSRTAAVSSQLTGTSDTTASPGGDKQLSAQLTGTSDLAAVGVRIAELAAVLGGTSNVDVSEFAVRNFAAVLTGTSDVVATGTRTAQLQASLVGSSNFLPGGKQTIALSASLNGRSILVEGRGLVAYKKERAVSFVAPKFPNGGVGLDAYAEYLREVKALGGMFNTVAGLPHDGIDRLPTPSKYPASHVGPVFACVATRMQVYSEIQFAFQTRLDNGVTGELYRDGRLKILERPWAGATTGDLLSVMELDASTAGNSFWVLNEDGDELVRLDPQFTSIVLERVTVGSGTVGLRKVAYIVEYPESDPVVYLAGEVAHYMPIPDPYAPWRGMSWITPLLGSENDVDSFIQSHKRNTLQNRAAPALAVVFPPLAAKEVVDAYRDEFERLHGGGFTNRGKTLFTGGGADIKTIGMTWEDLDLRAVQGHGETRIAACAGVPPIVVGLSEGLASATYSNYGQARRRFADGTLRHLWRCASGALETLVPPPRKKDRLWYSDRYVAFVQEDVKDEADIRKSHASTIRQLIDIGFEPSAAVYAVTSGDLASLAGQHTGLYSVQLQPPLTGLEGNDGEEVDPVNDEEFDDETEEVNA